ncbi:MAG: tetratricopeptide repeat protein [Novosphingobium sp.]|nr:tetratricopeptide repeat protein [Novosphingobium sp.]
MQQTKDDARFDEMIAKVQNGSMRMSERDALAIAGKLYGRHRYGQAANVCNQLLKHKPSLSDAHSILGVSLAAMGKRQEGIAALKQAVKLNGKVAAYHSNLGEIYRLDGNLADATVALQKAIELDPRNAQANNNLGIVRFEGRNYDEAIKCYRKAIEINPNFPEAYNNLGNALRKTGDITGAADAYQNALGLREIYPEAYNNLGTLLREMHKPEQAEHALRKAISQNPRYVEAYNNLAAIYHAENNDADALRQLSEALKVEPKNARSLLLTARIQSRRGNTAAAEQACQFVLAQDPDNAEALTVLGTVKHELDKFDEALALLAKAVELRPDAPETRNYYGIALKSVGRLDEAREQLLKGLEINGSMYGAYANLNDLIDFSKEKDLFDKMETIMETVKDQRVDSLLPLHYAYAKGLEDNGQHEKALEHYITGGQMKRAQLTYVEEDTFAFFDAIKKAFPAKIFKDRPFEGISDERPLFIVGMPRSGSTLVEQIISSHKDIYGAGEVKYFSQALHRLRDRFPALSRYPDMVSELSSKQFEILGGDYLTALTQSAGDAMRVTDKLLTNYFFVGLLHLLFPKAKFINTRRDPIDTCLSGFTKLFKDDMPHSYDLGELGRYYRQYDALMKHWEKVLPKGVMKVVEYEQVVADTETNARELIDFIGLDWDDACLAFHESKRPVKTASVAQVRKPIYKTSVERWKKYGPGLQPLVDAIAGK